MNERAIFDAALTIADPALRSAYLEAACAGDIGLKEHIEGLLAMHGQLGDFLEQSPPLAPRAAALEPLRDATGTVIGPYKLLQQIGEGGFGVVYMAEQTEPMRRLVALKIIKPGMDTKQVIARFEAERQALALMDHPNIAKVLDGGTTQPIADLRLQNAELQNADLKSEILNLQSAIAQSRPYFVMELVRGVPITEFCDRNQLTARARLRLFLTVCQAVQHAHHKGVIHRDLKPTNVMVTLHDGVPVVKVIDFGVAKATAQRLTEKTLFTGFGQLIGTPAYMSPEQAEMSGLDIDTRSDIYSLGVLLYELLTGTTPLDAARLRAAGYAQMQRLIREEEPPRPSTRLSSLGATATVLAGNRGTDSKQLARLLAGDLDWIVMKALEKDRNRRYETPAGFAEDVERYLRREAILARPPSAAYRLGKFAQRNRGAVLAAAAVAAALLVGTAAATWQAIVATRAQDDAVAAATAAHAARQDAEAEASRTRAVLDFLENKVFAAARPEGLAGGLGRDVTLRRAIEAALPIVDRHFADQPLSEARLRLSLGDSFSYLGEAPAAAAQYERARALYTKHLGAEHPDTLTAAHNLASSYYDLGRRSDALKLQEQTLALRCARLGADHPDTLLTMHKLAASLDAVGRRADGLKFYEKTLALRQAKLGYDHPDAMTSMNYLAVTYTLLGRHADALNLHEQTLALKKAKLGPDHPDTLGSMYNLAAAYTALGRHDDALKLREETLVLQTAKLGRDHPDTLRSMHNLAANYAHCNRLTDALKLNERALALRQAKLGPDHPDTLMSMYNLAISHAALGRHADALKLHEQTLALRKAKLGPDHPDTLASMNNVGNALAATGRHADALRWREQTLGLRQAKLGSDHLDTLASMHNLANTYDDLGRHADALKLRERTLALRQAKLGADHPDTLASMNNLANSLWAVGRHADSLKLHEETLALRQAKLGADHPDTIASVRNNAAALCRLGGDYSNQGKLDEAVRLLRKSIDLYSKNSQAYINLGITLARQGKDDDAKKLDDAIAAFRTAGELDPRGLPPQLIADVVQLRLRIFERAQDAEGCRATAEMWENLKLKGADNLYDSACYRGVTAAAFRAAATRAAADSAAQSVFAKQADAEADRAMAWLRQAVQAGFKDAPHLKQDKDLDVLRDRADFQKLAAELEAAQ